MLKVLGGIDRTLTLVLKVFTITVFLVLMVLVTTNVILRRFPVTTLTWIDEIEELSFAALVFYGAAGVWMVKGHFSVGDWFGKLTKSERARGVYRLFLEMVTLLFAIVLFFYSLKLTGRSIELTSVLQIPKRILYSAMPVSSAIMVLYSITYVVRAVMGIVNPKALAALHAKPARK